MVLTYAVCNTFNVQKALQHIGLDAVLTADRDTILAADGVILPGVGAYASAISVLRERGLIDVIHEVVARNIPLLGICLGMQLLFDESEEYGPTPGLGIMPGTVKAIPNKLGLRVPHMGWNQNILCHKDSDFSGVADKYTYFVHSYYVDTNSQYITTTANYGIKVPGIVEKGNVYGMQFHPEKSGAVGLNLLRTFGNIILKK